MPDLWSRNRAGEQFDEIPGFDDHEGVVCLARCLDGHAALHLPGDMAQTQVSCVTGLLRRRASQKLGPRLMAEALCNDGTARK